MAVTDHEYPRLRNSLAAAPVGSDGDMTVQLHDTSGITSAALNLSVPAFELVRHFDGNHRLVDIQADYARQFGRLLMTAELIELIERMDEAGFLDTPRFQAMYATLVDEYRNQPARPMRALEATGSDAAGLQMEIDAIVAEGTGDEHGSGSVVGLIAPHLDWPRGRPCYAKAYAALAGNCRAKRFVILGTNHFGQSASVVATAKDFETPFGRLGCDRDFLGAIERRLGASLLEHELDHANEHSIELQIPFVHHLFNDDAITLVPVLCPDPCGPTGTEPYDGRGIDLRRFAEALGEAIADDPVDTCVIVGADLSHVGMQFGDERRLDPEFLDEVARQDADALDRLDADGAEPFRRHLAATGNPTRICSAGAIFTLATALPDARPERLGYHQAADEPTQCCVTCTAYAFRKPSPV